METAGITAASMVMEIPRTQEARTVTEPVRTRAAMAATETARIQETRAAMAAVSPTVIPRAALIPRIPRIRDRSSIMLPGSMAVRAEIMPERIRIPRRNPIPS